MPFAIPGTITVADSHLLKSHFRFQHLLDTVHRIFNRYRPYCIDNKSFRQITLFQIFVCQVCKKCSGRTNKDGQSRSLSHIRGYSLSRFQLGLTTMNQSGFYIYTTTRPDGITTDNSRIVLQAAKHSPDNRKQILINPFVCYLECCSEHVIIRTNFSKTKPILSKHYTFLHYNQPMP